MIIVNLRGGLGNQMFQYALGRVLSITNKDTLKFDLTGLTNKSWVDAERSFKLDHFTIQGDIASRNEVQQFRNPYGLLSKILRLIRRKILRQFYIGYKPTLLNKKGDVYLDGYFQSELYFQAFRDTLLSDFRLKEAPSEKFQIVKKQITTSPSVSVHIRRGDYSDDLKTKLIWSVFGIEYYTQALSYLEEKIGNFNLFVFSNDSKWVQETMTFKQPTYYVSEQGCTDYEELVLMSLCDHNIIANSTFSWWGAWLNNNPDKIVITPRKWTRRHSRQHKNIIPQTWIRL